MSILFRRKTRGRSPTFPGLSIGSSSSCFVAFAFPLPLAVSVVAGVDLVTAAGFEKTLVTVLAGRVLDVEAADGFCTFPSWRWGWSSSAREEGLERSDTYCFCLYHLKSASYRAVRLCIVVTRNRTQSDRRSEVNSGILFRGIE